MFLLCRPSALISLGACLSLCLTHYTMTLLFLPVFPSSILLPDGLSSSSCCHAVLSCLPPSLPSLVCSVPTGLLPRSPRIFCMGGGTGRTTTRCTCYMQRGKKFKHAWDGLARGKTSSVILRWRPSNLPKPHILGRWPYMQTDTGRRARRVRLIFPRVPALTPPTCAHPSPPTI